MASGKKAGWKFPSLSHKRSPSSAPSSSTQIPKEYLCPISGLLMEDPVILPTGQTFERVCIKACIDLCVDPPPLLAPVTPPHPITPPPPLSPSTQLIPNFALRSSIHTWCSSTSTPKPAPLELSDAIRIVHSLASLSLSSSSLINGSLNDPKREHEVVAQPLSGTQSTDSFNPSPSTTTTASGEATRDESPRTTSDPHADSPLEAQILAKLKSSEASEQEEGLLLLRRETRDSVGQRATLCTTTLLAALRPFLLSRFASFQSNAAACLVNLSLESRNKTPIVRSGAVPPLVSALKSLDSETRSNAAAALFSLSVDEENKGALGALGALPPLLALLSRPNEDPQTTGDALLALYHLSLNCPTNQAKLAKLESAGTLVRILGKSNTSTVAHVALMVMGNLSNSNEGRAALMNAGAVETVVSMLRTSTSTGNNAERTVEQCVAVIYGMSKGSLRFRGVAKAAGAEEVLAALATEGEEDGSGDGERVREMARKAWMAVRGEDYGSPRGVRSGGVEHGGGRDGEGSLTRTAVSFPTWSGGGVRSGELGGGRRRHFDGVNSTEF